jgi:hypothetical protein
MHTPAGASVRRERNRIAGDVGLNGNLVLLLSCDDLFQRIGPIAYINPLKPIGSIHTACFNVPKVSRMHFLLSSFIHQWFYSLSPGLFFSSVMFFTQTVGSLGPVISPRKAATTHRTT